uniref:UBX domain-containing protein n=1 Tax=Echeneis naucrates TaxID=173247 RepID=A0A665V7M8_ECHNA
IWVACTGIDNIAEAITLLELNNWDLVVINFSFLHSNFSSEASQASMYGPPSQSEAADAAAGGAVPPASSSSSSSSPPSSSTSAFCPINPTSRHIVERQPRMLNFRVEYRQRSVELVLEEGSTVGEIKQILETELGVPASKMQLKGWKSGDVSDSTLLRSLHLPKNNSLYVLTPDIAATASTSKNSGLQESLNQNFMLIISHREAQRDYNLNFPGSRTIQEVKRNISDLTNIPVRHQQWEGWPASASDDSMTLAASGISHPCHSLSVCRRSAPANAQEPTEECADVHMISDSEGDDFEDASEFGVDDSEMFGMGTSSCRKSPMMPENSENEADALLHFTAEFSSRYGETHPMFFIGSLEAASQEAFYGKARDRKLLAIYLHNDDSVLSNVFCSQMMCADSIVSYLSQNFITWAWDVTKETNKARLLTMCTRHFGSAVTQTIRTYKTDQFPLLLIVMGKRTSNEVLNVIQGNTTVDELMMRLMGAMEIFTAQQQEDIKDEDEREAREMVKREQDEAYRLSLEADRKKVLKKKRKKNLTVFCAIRLSLEQALPPEPAEESGEQISKLRIRTPSGEFLERRFLGSCKLQVLFDFVASKGYPFEEFKLLTTFPRRNITQLDPGSTLLEAKLFPQETLFLEAKE